jgi:hypothetical protein
MLTESYCNTCPNHSCHRSEDKEWNNLVSSEKEVADWGHDKKYWPDSRAGA